MLNFEETSQLFFNLFIQRKDTYAVQSEKSYERIPEELTQEIIKEHLNGQKTIGTYQFNTENKLKWICFDFDGQNLEEEFEKAKKVYEKLKQETQSILLEFSGKKGYHVWVFCEETDGTSAKYWATEATQDMGVHEIFPKQEKINDKYGNLVKLPLCIHQVSKQRSYFFNEKFEALNTIESIEYLKEILKQSKFKVPKVIVKEIIRTIIKNPLKTNAPTYINYLINHGSPEGERHKNVWIITKELYNCGYSANEIIEAALTFNKNCEQPKTEYLVTNHVNYLLAFPEKYLAKETITPIDETELCQINKIDYEKVLETYQKWLYVKDNSAIDLALAVAISRKQSPVPLWIIMIAPSGDGKSELLRPLEDKGNASTTEVMSKITPNTFLSGMDKGKTPHTDFAETLSNNPKLFLTFDFAQFVKLDSKEKSQIWAQLRDLYDGFMERKAFNVKKKVDGIKVNWLICSTPIVDSELLVQQELGTRELLFRFDYKELNQIDLMNRVWDNSKQLELMRTELRAIVRAFIEKKESEFNIDIEISPEVKQEIQILAQTVTVLRAATESDNFSGELTNFVYEEMPTRILLQLKSLFIALKNLSSNYTDEQALKVIKKIVLSSIHPIRLKILQELMKEHDLSTTDIQKRLGIGWKTVNTQLGTAWQLGLVTYHESPNEEEGQMRNWKKKYWNLTKHLVVDYLKKIQKN